MKVTVLSIFLIVLCIIILQAQAGTTFDVHLADQGNESLNNTLNISEMTEEQKQAYDAIQDAEFDILEMKSQGFNTLYTEDLMVILKAAYEAEDYAKVMERIDEINERKERAYEIHDSLTVVELKMQDFNESGLNITSAFMIFLEASSAFDDEKYDDTEDYLLSMHEKLEEIKAEYLLGQTALEAAKRNIMGFLENEWPSVLAFCIVSFFIGLGLYDQHKIKKDKKELRKLKAGEKVVKNLLGKAQKECFETQTMSLKTYEIKRSVYEQQALAIKQKIPVFEEAVKMKPIVAWFKRRVPVKKVKLSEERTKPRGKVVQPRGKGK